jgi:uncharacterized protein
MKKAQIMEILSHWNFWRGEREMGIERTAYVEELLRQKNITEVSIVSGVRRSGKSTILLQVLKKAIKKGLPKENTLYVNFEEPAFAPHLRLEFLSLILDAYLEKFNPQGQILVVLDEIQYVDGWEKFIRGLYDRGEKIKFYVTGSSSKLLSKEFGTALTGRIYTNEIFPLSFREFLAFKNKVNLLEFSEGKGAPALRNQFMEYLKYGGFPRIALSSKVQDKLQLLKDYYCSIIEKDIAQRYDVRDMKKIKEYYINLVTSVASNFSGYRAQKTLDISQPTANKFFEYANEVYLIQGVTFFDYSYLRQKANPEKVYVIDPGIYRAVSFRFSENVGRIFENLVFLEYRRKGEDIFYWKGRREVDFLLRKGGKIKKAVNVCWELNEESREREIAGIVEAMEKFKLRKGEIVTMGYAEEIKVKGGKIVVRNFLEEMSKEGL